ncbi:MAG: dimethylargininase [Kofleriaceae bacterium]|nr:N(G),N(G)-dimethylarginine dimethylaminohydrolase [Myxococcales bacterium]MCB9572313.1 dimethylargininase [Kofleriaceae bacterium]
MTTVAITRAVPTSFASALAAVPPDPPIDVARARAEHDAYRAALAAIGLRVVCLAAADALPDSCFVEDTAVVGTGLALITRPGAPSRRPEVDAVTPALARHVAIAWTAAPATIDGGDCLRVGATLFVGRSARTSADGVARLREVFAPRGVTVVAVDLPPGVLHLKCVVSSLGGDRVALADDTIPAAALPGARVVRIPADEGYAANVVHHDGAVVMADGHPRARAALEAAGLRVVAVDNRELRKADSALTCLSVLVDAA